MRALFFSAEGTRQEGEQVRGSVERGRLASIATGAIALSEPGTGEFARRSTNKRT